MLYQVFTEFDAYENAFQHAQVRMTLHRRERRNWAIGQMSLGRVQLQWGTSGGGMVSEGEVEPGGHALFIPLSDFTTNGVNGCRLSERAIMVAESGSEFCVSADSWNEWCSLFIPDDAKGSENPGREQGSSSGCRVVTLSSRQLRQVRLAVRKLIQLATGNATSATAETTTEAMLQQFAESAIAQTPGEASAGRGRPRLNRNGVVRLVENDLSPESNQTPCVGDLADAADVSQRTLLRIFHDWYGVSPARYARLRKIHAVRDALLAADSSSTTVTAVLIQHDISQFGRFAGVYRELFGESPSETLARVKR